MYLNTAFTLPAVGARFSIQSLTKSPNLSSCQISSYIIIDNLRPIFCLFPQEIKFLSTRTAARASLDVANAVRSATCMILCHNKSHMNILDKAPSSKVSS